jgi:hypothetical protein
MPLIEKMSTELASKLSSQQVITGVTGGRPYIGRMCQRAAGKRNRCKTIKN